MGVLSESQRFQIREAREALAKWDAELSYPGRMDIQRMLADHLRNLLAMVGGDYDDTPSED